MTTLTDDPNVLDEWLIAGAASSLAHSSAGRPVITGLLGQQAALWREPDGALRCRMGTLTPTVQERYGYVWVCCSGAPARPLFAFPEYDEPGRRIVDCGGIGVAVGGLRVVENFLDMGHFPYVHADFLGSVPRTEVVPYDVRTDADSGEIWASNCRFWQPITSASASGGVEAQYIYRVAQPFTAFLYKTCVPRPDKQDAIGLFVQPVDQERCIAWCLLVYFEDELTDTDLIGFQQTIFGQDKPILENHVLKRLPLEGRLEIPTRADVMSVTYRRWLKARGMRYSVHV